MHFMESINRLADSINTPVNDNSNYLNVCSNETKNAVNMDNECNSNSLSFPMANVNSNTSFLVKSNMTSSSVPEECLK